MILIPIENVDGAFVIDDMLCLKPEAIENSSAPKLLELIQLWSQHGREMYQEVFHLHNTGLILENPTVEFHQNWGRGHYTIRVDVPDWSSHESDRMELLFLLDEMEQINARKNKTREPDRIPKAGQIYLLSSDNGFYKIGFTSQPIEKRVAQLEHEFPVKLRVLHLFPADDIFMAERRLLDAYKSRNLEGEWFSLQEKDIESICKIDGYSCGQFFCEELESGKSNS